MKVDHVEMTRYAELIIRQGLCIKEGEKLQIRCNEHGLALAEAVGMEAYRQGAIDVQLTLGLDELAKARYTEAPDEAMDFFPDYRVEYMEEMLKDGYHRLLIDSMDPELLKDADPKKVTQYSSLMMKKQKPLQKYSLESKVKWCIAAFPSPAWAKSVFPAEEREQGMAKLWELIKSSVRLDREDPVKAWEEQDELLKKRCAYLNSKQFEKFHYEAQGTDFWVHMAEGHHWQGGSFERRGGNYFPNLPTEEVFSAPHRAKAEGRIQATLPLSLHGHLIEDFYFVFKDGKVVDFGAKRGEEILKGLLENDEGAMRLGEIALVDVESPIFQSGVIFNNTMYDENAACHFALGNAISTNLKGYEDATEEEREARGFNVSNIHVDFMVGSESLKITGYEADGSRDVIMEQGRWTEKLR